MKEEDIVYFVENIKHLEISSKLEIDAQQDSKDKVTISLIHPTMVLEDAGIEEKDLQHTI